MSREVRENRVVYKPIGWYFTIRFQYQFILSDNVISSDLWLKFNLSLMREKEKQINPQRRKGNIKGLKNHK